MQNKFFLFFVNTLKLLLLHLNIPTLDKLLTQIIVFLISAFLYSFPSITYLNISTTFFSSSTTAKAAASISLRAC